MAPYLSPSTGCLFLPEGAMVSRAPLTIPILFATWRSIVLSSRNARVFWASFVTVYYRNSVKGEAKVFGSSYLEVSALLSLSQTCSEIIDLSDLWQPLSPITHFICPSVLVMNVQPWCFSRCLCVCFCVCVRVHACVCMFVRAGVCVCVCFWCQICSNQHSLQSWFSVFCISCFN